MKVEIGLNGKAILLEKGERIALLGENDMGYIFNSAQLYKLDGNIERLYSTWSNSIGEVSDNAQSLSKTTNMKGEGATRIFDYLQTVHVMTICQALLEILADIKLGFADYYSKYLEIDSDGCDAVIDTDELEEIKLLVQSLEQKFSSVENEMKTVVGSISNISKQSYPGMGTGVFDTFSEAKTRLTELIDRIFSIENNPSSYLEEVRNSIQVVRQTIYEQCSGEVEISTFSKEAFLSSSTYGTLYGAMGILSNHLSNLCKNSSHADDLISKVAQQWQERQNISDGVKLGLAILEAVVFTAAIATTGPLGAAAIGGAIGLINGAITEGMNQWSTGDIAIHGGLNFTSLGYETAKSGMTGMVKGFTGALMAPVTGTTFAGKVFASLSKEAVNIVTDTGLELGNAYVYNSFEDKWDEITSLEHMTETAGKCIINSALDAASSDWFDDVKDYGHSKLPNKVAKVSFDTILGAGKKIVTKKTEDITDAFIEAAVTGLDDPLPSNEEIWSAVSDAWNDHSKVVQRAISGGIEAVTPSIYEETELYHSRVNKAIQNDSWLGPREYQYTKHYRFGETVTDYEGVEILLVPTDSYVDKDGIENILVDPNSKGSPSWELRQMKKLAGTTKGQATTVSKSTSSLVGFKIPEEEKKEEFKDYFSNMLSPITQ